MQLEGRFLMREYCRSLSASCLRVLSKNVLSKNVLSKNVLSKSVSLLAIASILKGPSLPVLKSLLLPGDGCKK